MGKGDLRSRRGKIFRGSTGKKRTRRKGRQKNKIHENTGTKS